MISLGTGLRNSLLGDKSLADLLNGGVIRIYSGFPPNSADDAATGQLLVTITNNGETTPAKKKIMFEPVVADSADYTITINGNSFTYTSGTSATKEQIVNGLKAAIDSVLGNVSNSTKIEAKDVYGKITTSLDANNNLIIEAVNNNEDFAYSVSSNLTSTVITNAAPGLHLSYIVSDGTLTKVADEVWMGKCVASGTAGYFRFEPFEDDDTQNSNSMRIQGTVGTVNSDMLVTTTSFVENSTQTIDTFTLTLPAHR